MTKRSGYRNGRLIYPVSVIDHTAASQASGTASRVLPDTIGTEQIIDNSVQGRDLNESVRNRLNDGFASDTDIDEIFTSQ